MDKVYDLIIIGAGPAGITAAVYAARNESDFLVLTGDIGGQTAWTEDIENYTGYQFITGMDLVAKFEEHMEKYGVDIRQGEVVESVRREGGLVSVRTASGEYKSSSVIIASGKMSKELGVPGEKEFKNKGLTYCATCDGPLFAGKDVAVIGGGNSALGAAIQLSRIAGKVYVVNITDRLGGEAVLRRKVEKDPNIIVTNSASVSAIKGDAFVSAISIRRAGEENDLAVQGVFVEIGLVPNSSFAEKVDKNDVGEIKVNCRNETNVPGVFAAGDVTDVPEKQIVIAAGEGSKAALSAFHYLAAKE